MIDHPVAAKGRQVFRMVTSRPRQLLVDQSYCQTEISKLLRAKDRLTLRKSEISLHITNFTAEFENMIDESFKEFEKKPNPGIFDIFFQPISTSNNEIIM